MVPRRSRDERALVAAALVDSLGTGCFLAGSIIYFTGSVGLSGTQVGLGLSTAALVGFLATMPVGRAADRRGSRAVLLALLCVRAIGFALYAAASSFTGFLVAAVVVGLAEKPTSAVQQLLTADVVGEAERQRVLAKSRAVRNVGMGAGTALAALMLVPSLPFGPRAIVLANCCSFVLAAILVARVRVLRSAPSTPAGRRVWRLPDRGYMRLTSLNGMLTLHMTLLATGLPLWIVTSTSLPDQVIPALILANTVIAVLLQVPVAMAVRTARHATLMLRIAGIALGGCCVLLAPLGHVGDGVGLILCAVALVALTAAELAQAAGGWDLSFRRAPDELRGQYVSFFSLGVTGQTILGPLLVTSVVIPSAAIGWSVLGALIMGVTFASTRTRHGRAGARAVARPDAAAGS